MLAKGYSGISLKTLKQLIDAFNCSCLSWVPEQGTVGASGAYGIHYHIIQFSCFLFYADKDMVIMVL